MFTEITPATLMRLIGTHAAPVILDVTTDADFQQDPTLVPTARRVSHAAIWDLATTLTSKRVVVVCQKGKKLSHGSAAVLRQAGIPAEALTGGNMGWRDAGLPRVPAKLLPNDTKGPSVLVTRHRPKIDRIACPWLIRRFIDPSARFLFVPPSDVHAVAEKFDATVFDMPNGDWSHDANKCTFDTMLARFGLSTPPLERLATVVRAADTNCHDLAPEAAGLLAISVGLSRAYKDDNVQLEAGIPIYDALYRWARDGANEGHDWRSERAK